MLYVILGKTHNGHEQGGFSGTVLAEDNVGFTLRDMKADPLKHFLPLNVYPKVFDLEHASPMTTTRICHPSHPHPGFDAIECLSTAPHNRVSELPRSSFRRRPMRVNLTICSW